MCINARVSNNISMHASNAVVRTGVGALMGAIASPIGAVGGALFGLTSYCVEKPVIWLTSKVDPNLGNHWITWALRIAKFVLPFIASAIIAAMYTASFVGFPIGFGSALLLTFFADPERFMMASGGMLFLAEFVQKVIAGLIGPCLLRPCMTEEEALTAQILRAREEDNRREPIW
jgi:hypothetical protein